MRTRKTTLTTLTTQATLCVLALLVAAGALLASGGGSYRVWFVDPRGPRTGDLDSWLEEPPILERTFDLPWLIAAWREGMGRPLSEVERQVMADRVALRRSSAWSSSEFPATNSVASPQSRWRAVRRELGLNRVWAATSRSVERPQADGTVRYLFFENCPPSSFGAAADTYADRRLRTEYDEAALRAWVAAQDQVFANCPNIREPKLPDPAPDGAPRLLRDDRRYQIGAAQFYAGLYEDAIVTWDALAAESGELAELARYLTGRAALRWHDVGAAEGEERRRAEQEARRRLSEFAASSGSSNSLVDSSRGLLDLLELRVDPVGRQRRAALAIATAAYGVIAVDGASPAEVRRVWDDLLYLTEGYRPDRVACSAPVSGEDPAWSDAGEELLVWLTCMRFPFRADLHARTDQATGPARALWATAALVGVSQESEVQDVGALRTLQQMTELVPELFDAGSTVPTWLRRTAAVHAARIQIAHGLHEGARAGLADIDIENLRLDDRNRLLIERARSVSSFGDWVANSSLEPVAEGWSDASELIWDMGERRYPRVLRSEAVQVVSASFRSQAVRELARHRATPAWLRPSLSLRGWLLAALDADAAAEELARELLDLEPQALANGYDDEFRVATLSPAALEDLRRWLDLPATERPWWTAWMLLQHDELGVFLPDVEQGLWPQPWCGAFHLEPDLAPLQRFEDRPLLPEFEGSSPYATGAELMNWTADQVFARLEEGLRNGSAEGDPSLAQALHLLVRRTKRMACRDGEISQRAFQALHRHYAGSDWANATPYWYE